MHDLDDVRGHLGDRWAPLRAYNLALATDPGDRRGAAAPARRFRAPGIPPETLDRIAVPTRLVWGTKDTIVPVAVGRRAAERYGWPMHVLEGVGNEPALEAPAAFVEAVLR